MRKMGTVLIAHNIRSLWNVGAFFRCADCFGIRHIYLTGYTACPPRKEIAKTAIGAQEWIPWSYERDPLAVIEELRSKGYTIIALEKTKSSVAIQSLQRGKPACLIVGHEILGVPDELQKVSDAVVHIPMRGKKESLNVAVAAGIAMYELGRGE